MKRNRGVMPPTIAYARNQIQFADIQIDRGEIADAKAEVKKAIQSLESLVSVKRDASNAEIADDPTQQDMVAGLMFSTSALLLDGRCMTLQRDFGGALKRYEEALRAAKRIQRFDNGLATGTNFLGRAYREMHLVYWKQGKTAEAASAYERAMQIVEKREDNPTTRFLDRLFVLIECDRARYAAKSASDTAREALQRAEHRFEETFAADPAKDWELMLYLATARVAVASANGDTEARTRAERDHADARAEIANAKPNTPLLQELDLSSIQ
jgi:tetratricopeptide (TPR) repeat protein